MNNIRPHALPTVAALFAVVATLTASCAREKQGVPHPPDEINYPVDVAVDPSGELVWVVSGNFDLSYHGGAVLAVDVKTHEFLTTTNDAGEEVAVAAQIGGFPGDIEFLQRDGRAVAGYVLSRETDRLYTLKMSGDPAAPLLECDGGVRQDNGILDCPSDDAIATADVLNDDGETVTLEVGNDPISAHVHHARHSEDVDVLLTGAMVDGTLATYELDTEGSADFYGAADLQDGLFAFAESSATGRIYTAHKNSNVINVIEVSAAAPEEPFVPGLARDPVVTLVDDLIIPSSGIQDYARDLAVSTDGRHLYAAFRSPSTVIGIFIGEGDDQEPDERVVFKLPVGQSPGSLQIVPAHDNVPELLYVSCFGANRIDVIDPALGQVIDSIATGQGPYGLAFLDNPELGLRRLYVAVFHAQRVGVVELDPASAYFHVEIAEIK